MSNINWPDPSTLSRIPGQNSRLPAKIYKVRDGDTVEAIVQFPSSEFCKVIIRLSGIDTPELRPRKNCKHRSLQRQAANLITSYLENLILNIECTVILYSYGLYSGRMIGDIIINDAEKEINITSHLIKEGLAKEYKNVRVPWTAEELNFIVSKLES